MVQTTRRKPRKKSVKRIIQSQSLADQDPLVKKKIKGEEETKEGHGAEGREDGGLKHSESISQEKENIKLMEILSRIEKVIDSKNRMLRKQNKVHLLP